MSGKISEMTAAVVGDLNLANTDIEVSINVTTSPLTRRITFLVLATFLAATAFGALNVHAAGFTGPLTGNVTGNVSGSSGSTTGNAATATLSAASTKLATARAINGVNFDGTADIVIPAGAPAAGSLTGTTIAANVITSSLTTIGTLVAGHVPASLVTPGTFGAGNYSFPGTLSAAGLFSPANGIHIANAVDVPQTQGAMGQRADVGMQIACITGTDFDAGLLNAAGNDYIWFVPTGTSSLSINHNLSVGGTAAFHGSVVSVDQAFVASTVARIANLGIGQPASLTSAFSAVGLPTAAAGLAAGDVWVDTAGGLNILKIV